MAWCCLMRADPGRGYGRNRLLLRGCAIWGWMNMTHKYIADDMKKARRRQRWDRILPSNQGGGDQGDF